MERLLTHKTQKPDMAPPFADALCRTVLTSPGDTDLAARRLAFASEPVAPEAAAYLAKVRHQSYRILPGEIPDLLRAGMTQDAVFELTIATAVGAAVQHWQSRTAALKDGG